MRRNDLVKFNDNLYFVKWIYPTYAIRVDKTQELKELLECDIVLRHQEKFLYCELIPEAEIVE
jgi:hypothetical protein